MNDYFSTSVFFLDNRFDSIVKMNDYTTLISLVEVMQKKEMEEGYDVLTKKSDLIILNAYLCRHLALEIVSSYPLHETYNFFYMKINELRNLLELQDLEKKMIFRYLNKSIYEIEDMNDYTINRIIRYVFMNLESNIKVKKIASELRLTPNYISQIFRKKMKKSLKSFIIDKKLERAKMILETTKKKILEIAENLSFTDSAYFINLFKEKYGVTPLEYRNKI